MGKDSKRASVAAGGLAELTAAQLDEVATEIVNATEVIAYLAEKHAVNRLRLTRAVGDVLVDMIFNCSEILRGDVSDAGHDN